MHRITSNKGIELIKNFEGFKSEPYVCAGGYFTIGYGHKLLPSDRFKTLTEEGAEILLRRDLMRFERAVIRYITEPLSVNQFDALVSFTYNLGSAALQRSSLRQKVNYGDLEAAAKEFNKWVYAGGKRRAGLVRRRKIESKLFLSNLD